MPLPFPLKFARLAFALVCGALLLPAMAGGQATQYKDAPPLLLGAAWYPEQWDEATDGPRFGNHGGGAHPPGARRGVCVELDGACGGPLRVGMAGPRD